MNKYFLLLITSILLTLSGFTQKPGWSEEAALDEIISNFFDKNINPDQVCNVEEGMLPEGFLMIINIDTSGIIDGIYFLTEDKYKGSVYEVLRKMTVSDFKSWRGDKWKGIILIIPIFSTNGYNEERKMYKTTAIRAFMPAETSKLKILRSFPLGRYRIIKCEAPVGTTNITSQNGH